MDQLNRLFLFLKFPFVFYLIFWTVLESLIKTGNVIVKIFLFFLNFWIRNEILVTFFVGIVIFESILHFKFSPSLNDLDTICWAWRNIKSTSFIKRLMAWVLSGIGCIIFVCRHLIKPWFLFSSSPSWFVVN